MLEINCPSHGTAVSMTPLARYFVISLSSKMCSVGLKVNGLGTNDCLDTPSNSNLYPATASRI